MSANSIESLLAKVFISDDEGAHNIHSTKVTEHSEYRPNTMKQTTTSMKPNESSKSRGHHRGRSTYSQSISIPANTEEELSETVINTKPRMIWTDLGQFHRNRDSLTTTQLQDAILILVDFEAKWIMEPFQYEQEHQSKALFSDYFFVSLLQWKHAVGHIHCFKNNKQFLQNLNHQITTNLADPTTYGTTNYNALILDHEYYQKKDFYPEFQVKTQDILCLLRGDGEQLDPFTARLVIKQIVLQSNDTFDFVSDSADSTDSLSLEGLSSCSLSTLFRSRFRMNEDEDVDLSEDDFLESLISDGLSGGFPDTFSENQSCSGSSMAVSPVTKGSAPNGIDDDDNETTDDTEWVNLTPLSVVSDYATPNFATSGLSILGETLPSPSDFQNINEDLIFSRESSFGSIITPGTAVTTPSQSIATLTPLTEFYSETSRVSVLSRGGR